MLKYNFFFIYQTQDSDEMLLAHNMFNIPDNMQENMHKILIGYV